MEIEVGTGISTRLGVRVGIGSTLTPGVGAKELCVGVGVRIGTRGRTSTVTATGVAEEAVRTGTARGEDPGGGGKEFTGERLI